MARYGARDIEIATQFGITKQTFIAWKKEHASLAQAVRAAKFEFDSDTIEQTLCKRATGYYFTETTKELSKPDAKTGEQKLIVTKTVKKHVAADITAIIFWLKNRRKADWSDKQQIEADVRFSDLPEEEIDRRIAELLAKAGLANAT
jgi:hypothetical protein